MKPGRDQIVKKMEKMREQRNNIEDEMEGKDVERGIVAEKAKQMDAAWGPETENPEQMDAGRDFKMKVGEEIDVKWGPKAETMDEKEAEWGEKAETMDEKEAEWGDKGENSNSRKRTVEKRKQRETEFDYNDIGIEEYYGKTEYRIAGSMAAKIVAFFLLVIFCFVGLCGSCASVYMYVHGAYESDDLNSVLLKGMRNESRSVIQEVKYELIQGEVKKAEAICRGYNIDLELIWEEEGSNQEEILWSTWNGYDTDLKMEMSVYFDDRVQLRNVTLNNHVLQPYKEYRWRIYIDPQFTEEDNFKKIAEGISGLYYARYQLIVIGGGGLFLCLLCFIFLMCSAGHRSGHAEIVPSILTAVHLEILIAIFGGISVLLVYFLYEIASAGYGRLWLLAVLLGMIVTTALVVWVTLFLMDIAVRFKMGKIWRNSLLFVICSWLGRVIRSLYRGLVYLINHIPSVMTTICICIGICIYELRTVIIYRDEVRILLWVMEKMILLPLVLYIALTCKRLLGASKALAEGQEDYVVDTSKMFGDFKKHGEHLNSLGRGISKAVAERMKSEHLKTELITNVSHDLKTPLTSIINYADLIWEETANASKRDDSGGNMAREDVSGIDHDRVAEYAEVLLRQSRRLKKLLEDLVEASKATTGNLEVNLESCEAGIILSQAVGEYEKRMEEKGLKLITRQPEKPVNIIADGRHLWRIFDNLLNNICKYAQENSRVYLSVETREEYVLIIFRNMSKYPLEVSADELQERFVRGDKSRHMEGNGLGLSIAGSLMELQNGKMDIVTDGDLFKVILQFERDYDS